MIQSPFKCRALTFYYSKDTITSSASKIRITIEFNSSHYDVIATVFVQQCIIIYDVHPLVLIMCMEAYNQIEHFIHWPRTAEDYVEIYILRRYYFCNCFISPNWIWILSKPVRHVQFWILFIGLVVRHFLGFFRLQL